MKNLKLISFVGVGLDTSLAEIEDFKAISTLGGPTCEFGVLYSESQAGKRYPGYEFCNKFLDWGQNKIDTSLHLCGSEVIEKFLLAESSIIDLCRKANRTQLNINIKNYSDHDKLSDQIIEVMEKYKLSIILQRNASKMKFNSLMLSKCISDKLHLLHDSSGGFGREITSVVSPDERHFTGYAGGIKPDNVKKIVDLIEVTNINNLPYYIDMESGVREDNSFSTSKCRKIINNIGYLDY